MLEKRWFAFASILAIVLAGGWGETPGQGRAPAEVRLCACEELLDALIQKVETNYPGFVLEIRGTDLEPYYRRLVRDMRDRAATAQPGIPCLRLLQEYVAYLRDGHLFVGGRPSLSPSDSSRLVAAAPRIDRSKAEVLRYLAERDHALDPVEGLWFDPAGIELAVTRWYAGERVAAREDSLVAFVVESNVEAWKPGDVKAKLWPLPDGSYDVILYDDARAPTRPHVYKRGQAGGGRLQRGGLLFHVPPTTWGKRHPVPAGHEGRIDPLDPRAPVARIAAPGVVVFHVPSNVPTHASRLNALVEQFRGALARAETLIIDLRGNEGGSTFVTNVFLSYLETSEKRPPRYLAEGEMAVLSTPDNIAYFERLSWAPAGLVERLRRQPGLLVPFEDPVQEAGTGAGEGAAPLPPAARPARVAILMDGMTVSAAEAFVLKAMRNQAVTLFGQPTGASIDYQTVGIVRFGCRESGLYVGYPTIVGSDRLPEGAVRPDGIQPDVLIDPSHEDPIRRIIEYYRETRAETRPGYR